MVWIPIFFIGFSVCWYGLRAQELFTRQSPSRLHRLLGCIFVWWGLSTLKDLAFYIPQFNSYDILGHTYFTDGCGVVTFTLLLLEFTIPGWVTRRRTALLLLPFLTFFVLHFFIHELWFRQLFTVFFFTFAWVSVLIAIYYGHTYAQAIRQNYSDLEDVDISWLWYTVAAFIICMYVWWMVAEQTYALADGFYYSSSLIFWHFVLRGVNRLRPSRLPVTEVPGHDDRSTAPASHQVSVPTTRRKRTGDLAGRLEQLMEDEQLYLNPDLTMADLTARLGTNRTYLSDYLSTELNTTFYDYINRLRIERRVIPMMQADRLPSLETIASEAGFKSITTFRRAFRKLTGQLPSEYMRH